MEEIFEIDSSFTKAQRIMAVRINDLYKNNKICMISYRLKTDLLELWANDEEYFARDLSRGSGNISEKEIDLIKNLHSNPTGLEDNKTISRRNISIFVNRGGLIVGNIIENRRGVTKIRETKPRKFRGFEKSIQKGGLSNSLNPSNSQNNLINFNSNNTQNPIITNFQQNSISAQNSFLTQNSNQAFTLQQPIQNSLFIQNPQNFDQLQNQDIQQDNQIQTELPEDLMQENFDLYNQQEQNEPFYYTPDDNDFFGF